MKNEILLSPRLEKIAQLLPKGSKVADIGTDHAHLPIYLLKKNIAASVIACDLNEGPIRFAKENIKNAGLEALIEVRQGSGLEAISDDEVDTAVIAGMGGELIAEILKNIPRGIKNLFLQPMTMKSECRKGIHKSGFSVKKEYFVKEKEKIYIIIHATADREESWREEEYFASRKFEKSEISEEYRSRMIKKYTLLSETLKKAGQTEKAAELGMIKEAFENLIYED